MRKIERISSSLAHTVPVALFSHVVKDMREQQAEQIEQLIQSHEVDKARIAIHTFLKQVKSEQELFGVCEWYLRLGLYSEGFKLMLPKGEMPQRSASPRRLMWMARFLNLMGASEFAARILEHAKWFDPLELLFAGEIYLSNFEHEKAFAHYQQFFNSRFVLPKGRTQIAWLGLCDSLAGMGKFSEAIDNALRVLPDADTPLIAAIYKQAIGEYYARWGNFESALIYLKEAQPMFPDADPTTDHALLKKWLGYTIGQLGDLEGGRRYLDEAMQILRGLSLRDEAWLDVLRLQVKLGLAPHSEARRLENFPGLIKNMAHIECTFGSDLSDVRIYMNSGEYFVRGKRYLEMPKEIRLLAMLRVAGAWGITLNRALNLLWPEEFFSYPSLEGRMYQLLRRIKSEYECDVYVENGRLYLGPGSLVTVSVVAGGVEKRPTFLLENMEFQKADLIGHYAVGSTQLARYVNTWMEKGWIRKSGSGRSVRYHVSA